jgi:hypothetical protein
MDHAGLIRSKAVELGFDLCGFARAHPLDPAALDRWFERGWDAPGISSVRERRAEREQRSPAVARASADRRRGGTR